MTQQAVDETQRRRAKIAVPGAPARGYLWLKRYWVAIAAHVAQARQSTRTASRT